MKANNKKILSFIKEPTLFSIPVYQRNYEWGNEQCKKLFLDLENNVRDKQSHFLGTTVYIQEDGEQLTDIYNLIDGQQRITSCMLLLKALIDSGCSRKEEIEDRLLFDKYSSISGNLKLDSVSKDKEAFRLVMTDHADEHLYPSKVVENYKIFKKLISKSEFGANQLFDAMDYFNMICISLDNDNEGENPQVIFESLNSTGVSLTASDLIRNFILMQLSRSEQFRLYNAYWSKIQSMFNSKLFTEFIRHYLIMKTSHLVSKKDVYNTYKKYFQKSNLTSEEALKDMYKMAIYYDNLLNAYNMPNEINEIVYNINTLKKTIVYPYFLMLIDMKSNNLISWNEVKKLFYLVESYFFRRMLCGIESSGLSGIWSSLTNHNNTNELYSRLKQKILNNHFPTDKEFRERIINYPIYNTRGDREKWSKLVLMIVEKYFTDKSIDFDKIQVEHILPQKLSSDWRIQVPNAEAVNNKYGDTLGNLTITSDIQETDIKSFSDKKQFYKSSNILLTRNISLIYSVWNKDNIISRANTLANDLISIFNRPELTDEEAYSDVYGEHPIKDAIDVTGKKIIKLTINGKDYPTSTWISALIIFLDYLWDKDSNNLTLIKNNYNLNQKLFINIRKDRELSNGENIESNFSATTILALISKIYDVCNLNDEVSYTVK